MDRLTGRRRRRADTRRSHSPYQQFLRGGWFVPGTIFKRRGSWWVVLDHGSKNGRRVRKWASFQTRKEAETYRLQSASHPAFGAGAGVYGSSRLRVAPYLERWLSDYAQVRVRPSTYKRYAELVRVHLMPELGHVQLFRLSPQLIERCYQNLKGMSPTTKHHVASLLRQALKQAIRWGLIVQNPADLVDKPVRDRPELKVWSTEQASRFLDAARDTRYFLLYLVLLGTGLRLGEALSLQWSDIDLKSGVLTVRGGKTSNARRAILMPEALVRELRTVRGAGLIFSRRDGRPMSQWTIRDNFYALVDRLNLPRLRIHDLRHMHATLLLSEGTDLASVSSRLGHSSKAFTLQVYSHVLAAGQERAAEVANRLLSRPELTNQQPTKSASPKMQIPMSDAGNVVPPAGFEPALPA